MPSLPAPLLKGASPGLRGAVSLLLLLGLTSSVLATVRVVNWRGTLAQLPGSARLLILGLALATAALTAATLYAVARRGWPNNLGAVDLRVAFALLVWGAFLFPAFFASYSYSWALLWWGGVGGLFSLWLGIRSRQGRWRGGRLLDLGLFNLSLALALLQVGLHLAAGIFTTSLLSVPGSADELLEQSLCSPGRLRFGYPRNSLGYYDEEPQRIAGTQIAVIGDSFTLGIVPHSLLFTTVAEQISGYRIDSFGVARIGPPEYRIILRKDVLVLQPDVVIIAVFVGNDIAYSHLLRARHQGQSWVRSWLDRDQNRFWTLLKRLRRVVGELSSGRSLSTLGQAGGLTAPGSQDQSESDYPWTTDYRLEKPTYSRQTYLELEGHLAETICRPGDTAPYASFFEDMEALASMSAEAAFAVMLIPDEFQVEDALWKALPESALLDREQPQRIIRPWLESRDIPYLDLLTVFRSIPSEEGGSRRLYHLQDSHLNARGNRVAGEQLARLLVTLVKDR